MTFRVSLRTHRLISNISFVKEANGHPPLNDLSGYNSDGDSNISVHSEDIMDSLAPDGFVEENLEAYFANVLIP